jgi:hypothetical protein
MAADYVLFDGKNLSSLFKDIYDNQVNKKKNISDMIENLRKLIKNVGEAAVIAPIIKDLIEISVKNDEQLVKLATIAQRLSLAESKNVGEDGWLSESEKKQLLQDMEEVVDQIAAKSEERLSDIQIDIEEIKTKL